jgi:hypothetical protein
MLLNLFPLLIPFLAPSQGDFVGTTTPAGSRLSRAQLSRHGLRASQCRRRGMARITALSARAAPPPQLRAGAGHGFQPVVDRAAREPGQPVQWVLGTCATRDSRERRALTTGRSRWVVDLQGIAQAPQA